MSTVATRCECVCHMGGGHCAGTCCEHPGVRHDPIPQTVKRKPFHETLIPQLQRWFQILEHGPKIAAVVAAEGLLDLLDSTSVPAAEVKPLIEKLVNLWQRHKEQLRQSLNSVLMKSIVRLWLYHIELSMDFKVPITELMTLPEEFMPVIAEVEKS